MAMFKSKKTYIKRYAAKSADRKITFSPSVKSSFNSVSAPQSSKTQPSTAPHKEAENKSHDFRPAFADKGADHKNIYNVGNENREKSFVSHGTVITGAGIPRPEPIDKPDLSGVRAEANVRPVTEPDEPICPKEVKTPETKEPVLQKSSKVQSEYHFYDTIKEIKATQAAQKAHKNSISPQPEESEKPSDNPKFETAQEKEPAPKSTDPEPILDVHGIMSEIPKRDDPFENLPEGVVRIDDETPNRVEKGEKDEKNVQTAKTTESVKKEKNEKNEKSEKIKHPKKAEEQGSRDVSKKPAIAEKPRKSKVPKRSRSGSKSAGKVFLTAVKVVLLIAIVGGCGFYGYRFYTDQIAQRQALDRALAINYAPEDYILPETPQAIADTNARARDAAYKEAMKHAYVPGRGEVPNLFKYDYVKTCYLTFDDGPSGTVTESILDTLKKYDVKATFFLVGKNAQSYPDLVKRMYNEGHSLGNHSYSHDYGYMYSGDPEFDDEMNRCKNTIDNIIGTKYNNLLFRFPGGSFEVYKSFYIYNIQSEGYQYVDWTALTGDAETQNPDKDYIMNSLKQSTNGGTKEDIVVLMHDAGAKQITADTLPDVIEYLKSKNYVFKPIYNSNYKAE